MKITTAALFCLVSLPYVASAQLYKSVGADGRVTYSDTPPASAAQVERKPLSSSQGNELPPDLAAALAKNPVTLYTTDNCKPCDEGRDLLLQRGIPFAEKTVNTNEDLAVLRQASGDQQLPVLSVGSQKRQGFETDAWHAALGAAGYPTTSKLPKTYRNPAAAAAAGKKPQPEQSAAATPGAADSAPRSPAMPAAPAGNAPPGFRF